MFGTEEKNKQLTSKDKNKLEKKRASSWGSCHYRVLETSDMHSLISVHSEAVAVFQIPKT